LKLWTSYLLRLTVPYMSNPFPVMDKRVIELCAYIRAHYAEPIRMELLAETIYLSEGHMRMIFRQAMGMSPYQYALNLRMKKAKELLLTTQLPLSEVSIQIGFESMSHFISTFRQREGMTPAVYRRRVLIGEFS
jgi:transcriptional regulator GlxA family with amidase domain